MKFLPTLDLWNPGIMAAVLSGQLRLLPGQWIKCGGSKPSRFCGVTPTGSIVATHPTGSEQVVKMDDFRCKLTYWKSRVGLATSEDLAAERERFRANRQN